MQTMSVKSRENSLPGHLPDDLAVVVDARLAMPQAIRAGSLAMMKAA